MSRKKPAACAPGRPELPSVTMYPATCPRCHSTERTKLESQNRIEANGVDHRTGLPFTAVRIAYTTCRTCGQRYVVRSYENHPLDPGLEEPDSEEV